MSKVIFLTGEAGHGAAPANVAGLILQVIDLAEPP